MRSFSKKSQVELSLNQIVGLVIAIVIILATLAFFSGLMNVFLGPPDSGSQATMNYIKESVNALYHQRNKNDSCILKAAYLEGDWSIAGFNADGVITADNNFACALGKDCIEEHCGIDDNIIKPTSCGKGPCICLCDGGGATGVGDADGDDCQDSNAICEKFSRDIGFDTFYVVDPDGKECPQPYGQGSLCDLVIDGESCGGTNRNVRYSLLIKKGKAYKGQKEALIFDLIETSKIDAYYKDSVDCKTLISDLKRLTQTAQPVKTEEKKAGSSLADSLDKTQAVNTAGLRVNT